MGLLHLHSHCMWKQINQKEKK